MNDGEEFAHRWLKAWNAQNLPGALSLWAEDMIFESPLAGEITGSPWIRGKADAASYWGAALAQARELHFTVLSVLWDASKRIVSIIYVRERGGDRRVAAEIVKLNLEGLGAHGIALHGAQLDASDFPPNLETVSQSHIPFRGWKGRTLGSSGAGG